MAGGVAIAFQFGDNLALPEQLAQSAGNLLRKGALDHLDRKLRLGRKADVVRTDVAFRRAGSSVQPFGK